MRTHHVQTVDDGGDVVVARRSMYVTPAQVVSAIGGLVFIAFGIFAVARTGLSGPLSTPQTQVLGLQHTAAIGLVEIAVGAVLVLCGLSAALRGLSALIGIGLVVVGIIILAGSNHFLARLHTEAALGWVGVIVGGAVLLSALVVPRRVV